MNKLVRILHRNNKRLVHLKSSKLNWYVATQPDIDTNYLCDPNNKNEILQNVQNRKGIGDLELIYSLKSQLDGFTDKSSEHFKHIQENFITELKKIPNKTHPDVVRYGEEPKLVKYINNAREFKSFKAKQFHEVAKKLNLLRTEQLGNLSGNRSYFFLGELAEMEQALIQYTVAQLLKNGFEIVSVPDMLHRDIIESCGMSTQGPRTQVYSLDPDLHDSDMCLSGTSEMALGGYFSGKTFPIKKLPLKVAAVSRCYRAEISSVAEEKGIYRVHQFTKVEMFAVCKPEQSEKIMRDILLFQEEHFGSLGLHLRVLDMPPHELGAPAYRKYDIEAWLPGRGIFGEVSSTSNCTDYQSRRLGIKYKENENIEYAHTLNGTACAIPRLVIALIESYQNENGTVNVPEVLQKYIRGKSVISRQKSVPELKLIKNKNR